MHALTSWRSNALVHTIRTHLNAFDVYRAKPSILAKGSRKYCNKPRNAPFGDKISSKVEEKVQDLPKKTSKQYSHYEKILNDYAQKGDISAICSLLQEIINKFGHIETITVKNLVNALSSVENGQKILQLWGWMKQNQIMIRSLTVINELLHCLLNNERTEDTLRILDDMNSVHALPDAQTFGIFLSYCPKHDYDPSSILRKLIDMRDDVASDIQIFNTILNFYAAKGSSSTMHAFYNQWKPQLIPNMETLDAFLHVWEKDEELNVENVWMVLDHFHACKIAIDVHKYAKAVYIVGKQKNSKKVQELYLRTTKYGISWNDHLLSTFVSAYGRCKDVDMMDQTLEYMTKQGFKANKGPFKAYLKLYLMDAVKATEVFHDPTWMHVTKDADAYTLLMKAHENVGDTDGMWRIFDEISEKFPPCAEAYEVLISHLRKKPDPQKLSDVLSKIQANLVPTTGLCNEMIDLFGSQGQLDQMLATFKEMEERKITSKRTYTLLLGHLRQKGNATIISVYDRMRKSHKLSASVLRRVMDGIDRADLRTKCRLLNHFLPLYNLDARVYFSVFKTLFRVCPGANMKELLEHLRHNGLEANGALLNYLTQYIAINQKRITVAAWSHLLKHASPTTDTVNAMMHSYVKRNLAGPVLTLYFRLKSYNLRPNVETFHILVDWCAKQNNLNMAQRWITAMKQMHIKPSLEIFNSLLWLQAKAMKVEAMLQTFEEMKKLGILPNAYSFNAILCFYQHKRDSEEFKKTWELMKKNAVVANRKTYWIALEHFAVKKNAPMVEKLLQEMERKKLQLPGSIKQTIVHQIH